MFALCVLVCALLLAWFLCCCAFCVLLFSSFFLFVLPCFLLVFVSRLLFCSCAGFVLCWVCCSRCFCFLAFFALLCLCGPLLFLWFAVCSLPCFRCLRCAFCLRCLHALGGNEERMRCMHASLALREARSREGLDVWHAKPSRCGGHGPWFRLSPALAPRFCCFVCFAFCFGGLLCWGRPFW